jgi:hypothetical protein
MDTGGEQGMHLCGGFMVNRTNNLFHEGGGTIARPTGYKGESGGSTGDNSGGHSGQQGV